MLSTTLPLDIAAAAAVSRSSKREPWQIALAGPLREEDLMLLHSLNRLEPDPKAPLAKIRDPHHTLAKMVADNKPVVEISSVTGYSPSRIRTLENDPAFQELVAHYRDQNRLASADIQEQLKHVSLTALQILQERLEENPEEVSVKELQSIAELGLDRTGYGPSRQLNVSTNSGMTLKEMMQAVVSEQNGRIIAREEAHLLLDAEYSDLESEDGKAPPSSRIENSETCSGEPVQLQHQVERESGGRDHISEKSAPENLQTPE